MTTETDNFAANNQNDGEEIVYGDVNALSMFIGARITDQILAKMIPFLPNGLSNGDPTAQGEYGKSVGAFSSKNQARAFALMPGGGYPWVGTATIAGVTLATNAIGMQPGTLFQLIGDESTGTDSQLLPFTFSGGETFSIAANSSGNPRVDLLEMALSFVTTDSQSRDFEDATTGANTTVSMNKQRQVQCVYQVKQGTPAASPVVPTPDAGFCAIGAVLVNNGYATTTQIIAGVDTGGSSAVLWDLRIPLNVKAHPVIATGMIADGRWTPNELVSGWGWIGYNANAANGLLTIPCPRSDGRLIAVAISGYFATGMASTAILGRAKLSTTIGGGPSITPVLTFTPLANVTSELIAFDTTQHFKIAQLDTIDAAMDPSAGPTALPDVTDTIGAPIWCNGARCTTRPFEAAATATPDEDDFLALQINAGSGVSSFDQVFVYRAIFYVAEGL